MFYILNKNTQNLFSILNKWERIRRVARAVVRNPDVLRIRMKKVAKAVCNEISAANLYGSFALFATPSIKRASRLQDSPRSVLPSCLLMDESFDAA